MRLCGLCLLLAASAARADDGMSLRMRQIEEAQPEPLLQLDAMRPDRVDAEGGIIDRRAALFDLGSRARLAAEGKWWETGLAPSIFGDDLALRGWRASAELSHELGPFRVGVNASMARERNHFGDATHRMVGLFAYRTFRLSRWMHAWIVLGVAYEQWTGATPQRPAQDFSTGLALGTTFR
jgi:hypothetical protein